MSTRETHCLGRVLQRRLQVSCCLMKPHCNAYRLRHARHPSTSLIMPHMITRTGRFLRLLLRYAWKSNISQHFRVRYSFMALRACLIEHPVRSLRNFDRQANGLDVGLRHDLSSCPRSGGWLHPLVCIKPLGYFVHLQSSNYNISSLLSTTRAYILYLLFLLYCHRLAFSQTKS